MKWPPSFSLATPADASDIAALQRDVAAALTKQHGPGHWSTGSTERGVLAGMRGARVVVARSRGRIVGSVRLATKKPWAIDVRYFTPVRRPLYLTEMAVLPELQGKGIGRALLAHAHEVARDWEGDAIRLDAYDAAAGAGAFYAKRGYREVARVTYKRDPLVYYELLLV